MGRGVHKLESEEVDDLMLILRSGDDWYQVKKRYKDASIFQWLIEPQYDYVYTQVRYLYSMPKGSFTGSYPAPELYTFLSDFFTLRNLFRYDALPPIAKEVRVRWGDLLIRCGHQSRRERRKWGLTSKPPVIE